MSLEHHTKSCRSSTGGSLSSHVRYTLPCLHFLINLASVVPAMIHSFMFIYMACKNGTIHMELTMDPFYWTGIIAIITLAYLVFASWSVFRKMNYELFKKFVSVKPFHAHTHNVVG
jgi:hypothetical protein